ncbi:glycoside hydrolase family 16 protein [Xylogone sp. PMI_703]|nr:glycoside hydrolase family 16 protein [Xylogone sp. PMI_703]
MRYLSLLLGASTLLSTTFAQTWTDCNPMNVTCPDDPALGTNHTFYFNTSTAVDQAYTITAGSLTYGTDGAEFTVAKKGDSPTIQSQFYIFFGSVSVIMKAASGQGIISSIVLESDDLDEVDWEFMGGNHTFAETNYFGKGNQTSFDRAIYYPVSSDVTENFHNYTTHWTAEKLEWYIDGALVRTLNYGDALGGYNYPQTPMTVRIGIWAGGDPDLPQGTIEWAGGVTDYSKGPYTMYVQSATVNDFSVGKAYHWSDKSGSWQSIKVVEGNSTVAETLNKPPPLSVAQKWAKLPQTTKIGIYAGAGAGAAILLGAFIFTCLRQRKKGRLERDAYNARVEKERQEAYQDQIQLREKGFGGFDKGAVEKQGDDALGGWGGNHVAAGTRASQLPSGPQSPTSPSSLDRDPTVPAVMGELRSPSPGIQRKGTPVLQQPAPYHAQTWGNDNFDDDYSGANIPGSPGFNTSGPQRSLTNPVSNRQSVGSGFPTRSFTTNNGYQRF